MTCRPKSTYTHSIAMAVRRFLSVVLLTSNAFSAYAQVTALLQGTPIGSKNVDYYTGKPSETVNTLECAFDGDNDTYYASYDRSNTWVGLDLGEPHVIQKVGWCPRNGQGGRVQLGLFEGANREDFMDAVPLYLIPESSQEQEMTFANVEVSRGFRYVRYVGPNNARCNIAELAFYGYRGAGDDSKFYQVTNLPTVSIHTEGAKDITSKTVEQNANITITYDGGTRIQEYPIYARGRGNASWGFPKKPYRIKFADKSHHMLEGSPLESPAKAKKWTLINNYGDKTLMRNIVAFELSKRLGMPYTPYCQPVDVLLNGEYRGCYQLCDQITVDPNRVNITEMEVEDTQEPELTGGYLVEVDAYAAQESSMFTSNRGIPVTIKSPGEDDITREQAYYIKKHFNLMEHALWSSGFSDEENGYRKYLDAETFLRHFLVGEFSGNTDTYWSTYLSKDRLEDQFKVAACWDFDLAFDNDNRIYPVNNRSSWVYRSGGSAANGMASLVNRVLSDSYTDNRLKEIWRVMRVTGIFSDESLLAFVDSVANELDASQELNFKRWPILSQKVHQNVDAKGSYDAEVNVIRDFIPKRIDWIDKYLGYEEVYTDSTYYISTPEQLIEFAAAVNNGGNGSIAYLTADIDMSQYNDYFKPVGNVKNPFKGSFNGGGHRISNLHVKGTTAVGVFGVVTGGAAISDMVLDSSCSIEGTSYIGIVGMSSGSGAVTLSRLGNEATVYGSGINVSGIIGCNMGSLSTIMLTECYNAGEITGLRGESAAMSGWMGEGAQLNSCWNSAEVTGVSGTDAMARGNMKINNCYSTVGTQGTKVTQEQVVSGELCYLLNGRSSEEVRWYQTLGTDEHPTLNPEHEVVKYDAVSGTYYSRDIMKGDVIEDKTLDIKDIMAMESYLRGDSLQAFCIEAADVNGDGRVDVADVVAMQVLMSGGEIGTSSFTARMYSSAQSVKADGTKNVSHYFSCSRKITACQADIRLTEGLYILPEDVKLSPLAGTGHKLIVKTLDTDSKGRCMAVRVITYSTDNEEMSSSSGRVFSFTLHADSTFSGDGTMTFANQRMAAANGRGAETDDVQYIVSLAKTLVTDITIEPDMATLQLGDSLRLEPVITPLLATTKTLVWTSDNEDVATVSEDGLITAVGLGEVKITATTTDGSKKSASLTLTVVESADGIAAVDAAAMDSDVYDLNGRKVANAGDVEARKNLTSGIYIINGRKVLVRK